MWIFRRCPSFDDLARFAAHGRPEKVARHILRCETCRGALQTYCENEAFLDTLRKAVADSTHDKARVRLLERCMKLVDPEQD